MYYLDAAFLGRAEYDAGLKKRESEAELADGELYSVMYSLVENNRNREAATLPATILGKMAVHTESGLYKVNMQLLDKDLQPKIEVEGTFMDGLWIDVKKCVSIVDWKGERMAIPPCEAYMKSYDDGMDDFRRIAASEQITEMLALPASV